MDRRNTIIVTGTFQKILTDLFRENAKVSLLYDEQGLTRAEDFISEYVDNGNENYIVLANGLKIPLNTIIAVNGTFLSQYSEC